ncbi:hypothetical protein PybrP1_001457 [[Pythium] brassicae (nom. inval.)]|nr:hypothetical protein PybrP1_001457 [[Pythium] brassicae (nom. inval.)]
MELYGSDRSPSSTSSDACNSSSSSTITSSANSNSANLSVGHGRSSSLRDLDELLMGGNDLDALPFEFGCDFSAAFEDKYLAPPLSTSSTSRLATMGAESGFDILPPLSASLLSPPTNFYLNSPPSRFIHADQDRIRTGSCSRASSTGASMSVISFDRRSDAVVPRASSAASHSALAESLLSSSSSRCASRSDLGFAASPLSTPDGSECDDPPAARGSKSTHIGRWTKKEHELFLEGLKLYGKSWKKISSLVVTRTLVQIRTHAQKYLQKQAKNAQKAAAAAAAGGDGAPLFSASSKASRHHSQRLEQSFGDHLDAWKGAPISFPDLLSAHAAASSAFARTTASSPYTLAAIAKRDGMCKLDQLLQDEPSQYAAAMDGYYQSPLGTDDAILQQPLYASWPRSESHDGGVQTSSTLLPSASMLSLPSKRRRLDPLQHLVNPMDAMSSSAAAESAPHPHAGVFGLGAHQLSGPSSSSSTGLFNGMDFAPHLHAYASPSTQFAGGTEYGSSASSSSSTDSNTYSSWQLP